MIEIGHNVLVETRYQGSNTSIIRTPEGSVLVDAPFRPTDAAAWSQVVESYGPVRYLINTDHHADHTLGNAFLGGEVVAHHQTREKMLAEASLGLPSWLTELLPVIDPIGYETFVAGRNFQFRVPTTTFTAELTFFTGGVEFKLLHAPGHTPNTIAVYLPEQGIVFCGDAICEAGIPSFVDADIHDWLDTITKIERLNSARLVTGHGEVCGPEIIPVFRQQLQEVIGEVGHRIDRGQSRNQIGAEVTYEDRIHTCVNGWTGFPEALVHMIIVRSVERVYDDILRKRREDLLRLAFF